MWTTFCKRPYRFSFGFGYERWSIARRWIYIDFAWWRFTIVWELKEKEDLKKRQKAYDLFQKQNKYVKPNLWQWILKFFGAE